MPETNKPKQPLFRRGFTYPMQRDLWLMDIEARYKNRSLINELYKTADTIISELESEGLTHIKDLKEVPAVSLPENYFSETEISQNPTRIIFQDLTNEGRSTALHLVTLWHDHQGHILDIYLGRQYPDVNLGAQTFTAVVARYSHIVEQLPPHDQENLGDIFRSTLIHGPSTLLGLLPPPTSQI